MTAAGRQMLAGLGPLFSKTEALPSIIPVSMRHLKLKIAYDGTDFHGWQVQPGLPTIQGLLQSVLADIEGRPVPVHGAGRTDAGVHALAQVAAVELSNPIPAENLRKAMKL